MKTNFKLRSFLASKSQSRFFVTAAIPAICVLSFIGESSAATVLFADTFDRADNNSLNAVSTGKTGTLGALNWTERATSGVATDDVDIVSSRMGMQVGTGTTNSGIAYVDHNFIGYTTFSVAFDFAIAPNAGGLRQLGFGIGNTKAALDALTNSGAFGVIGISFDVANTIDQNPDPLIPETGVQILHGGTQQAYIPRTVAANDTLSATFTFANMNAGTSISYEVFHEGVSIYTGSSAWAATNTNYIGMFNTHRNVSSDIVSIDNFAVSIPEPSTALLGGLGLLALLRRRRA